MIERNMITWRQSTNTVIEGPVRTGKEDMNESDGIVF